MKTHFKCVMMPVSVKRNILIAVVIVFILSAIILTFTKAKYRTTESMPLLNGTINYTLADLNIVEMYLNGEAIDALPDGNYELTEESYCTSEKNEKDESITLSYDGSTKAFTVTPFNKKGTKCYLYFEEGATAGDTILASENAPTSSTTDWTGGTTYYYTGKPNNWVEFAGFYWRIIRINGDGSIRMIYQGTGANTTDIGTRIGTSAFNSSAGNKTYVGLVYDEINQHGYGTNSTIMNMLNNWYNNNLVSYEEDYIDTGTGFCSDRNMASGYNFNSSGTIYFAPYNRTGNGSLQCNVLDVLSQDNGKIPNSIGLLTSDEYVLGGSVNSYLDVDINYWTMSPFYYGSRAFVFVVSSSGYLVNNDGVTWSSPGVRPVINIRANVSLTGEGTSTNPFKVVGAS